jgi:hypothetical protein
MSLTSSIARMTPVFHWLDFAGVTGRVILGGRSGCDRRGRNWLLGCWLVVVRIERIARTKGLFALHEN